MTSCKSQTEPNELRVFALCFLLLPACRSIPEQTEAWLLLLKAARAAHPCLQHHTQPHAAINQSVTV